MRKLMFNIGCGRLQKVSTPEVEWINIDKFNLKEENPKARFVQADITKDMPFKGGEASHIEAFAMLGQIVDNDDFKTVMNEFWRLLLPGGTLRIYVPHKDFGHAYIDPFNRRYFNELSFSSFHYNSPQYKDHLSYYGFKPWDVKEVKTNKQGFIDVIMEKYERKDN